MSRLFGTDGVRGIANEDLTADFALRLAAAAAVVLGRDRLTSDRPKAVVGRDPRASGEFLAAAIDAGLAGSGVDVINVGIVPTPAVALLTAAFEADLGVMISASHNPMPDNGIKFFNRDGDKLDDAVEDEIEYALENAEAQTPTGAGVGRVSFVDPTDQYLAHLARKMTARLDGLKVVVDCANGAASWVAPQAYRQAGADVIELHNTPDGYNINDKCGSTHPDDLISAVIAAGADIGLAHDGDADRCLAVDANGSLIDGDKIVALLADSMADAGTLRGNTVVVTVMSNLGLKIALKKRGYGIVETAVGDRYVLQAMREGNFSLGGEQSGHVILSDLSSTGDGILTGLMMLNRMAETGKSLEALTEAVQTLPQVLINVSGVDKAQLAESSEVAHALGVAEAELGDTGRVLLRPSGTEPVVRVMVEAQTTAEAERVAETLAHVVRSSIAL